MSESEYDFKRLEQMSGLYMFKEFLHIEIPHLAVITVVPQAAFRPQRLKIKPDEQSHWMVCDVRIGHRSQLLGGEIPGEVISSDFANFEMDTAMVGTEIEVVVCNISDIPRRFQGVILGRVADGEQQRVVAIGLNSSTELAPTNHLLALQFDELIYKFTRHECGGFEFDRSGIGTDENLRLSVDCAEAPRMVSTYFRDGVFYAVEELSDLRILEIDPAKNSYRCSLKGL